MDGRCNGEEITIPIEELYRKALKMMPVILLIYLIPYLLLWHKPFITGIPVFFGSVFSEGGFKLIISYLVMAIIALITGIILHELLHAAGWLLFAKGRWKSLRFGIKMPEMAPYAHCTEPLPVYGYRAGIVLPAVVMGLAPGIHGMITGSFAWLFYGIFFTWAATGDLIVLWYIKGLKPSDMVRDHPEKPGCIITRNL